MGFEPMSWCKSNTHLDHYGRGPLARNYYFSHWLDACHQWLRISGVSFDLCKLLVTCIFELSILLYIFMIFLSKVYYPKKTTFFIGLNRHWSTDETRFSSLCVKDCNAELVLTKSTCKIFQSPTDVELVLTKSTWKRSVTWEWVHLQWPTYILTWIKNWARIFECETSEA